MRLLLFTVQPGHLRLVVAGAGLGVEDGFERGAIGGGEGREAERAKSFRQVTAAAGSDQGDDVVAF